MWCQPYAVVLVRTNHLSKYMQISFSVERLYPYLTQPFADIKIYSASKILLIIIKTLMKFFSSV